MTEPAALLEPLEPLEPMHDDMIDLCESFDPPTITATTPDHTPDHPKPQTP